MYCILRHGLFLEIPSSGLHDDLLCFGATSAEVLNRLEWSLFHGNWTFCPAPFADSSADPNRLCLATWRSHFRCRAKASGCFLPSRTLTTREDRFLGPWAVAKAAGFHGISAPDASAMAKFVDLEGSMTVLGVVEDARGQSDLKCTVVIQCSGAPHMVPELILPNFPPTRCVQLVTGSQVLWFCLLDFI